MMRDNLTIGRWRYLIACDYLSSDDISGLFDQKLALSSGGQKAGGRGQAIIFRRGDREYVLRHYLRGGLWGKLSGDLFTSFMPHAHRAFDELKLLLSMYNEGLPVPRPVASRETGDLFIRQDIVVERILAKDLSKIISTRYLTKDEMIRLGFTLRRFFEAGIMHTDLNIRNILLSETGEFYLIDFDKCYRKHMGYEQQKSVLLRLKRSFLKEKRNNTDETYYNDTDFALVESNAIPNTVSV
ncbi:MAG: 3-deoxy-D-manno-octulosonic acid kinase [Succinatimonas hippei]|nr:3-deoxy-D-manno-octulosonic acid kinase [Succinatimonas hippei]